MKLAVIKTGGKQYLVFDKRILKVEKLTTPIGETITFTDVLMVSTGKTIKIGNPHVAQASVSAKVIRHGKANKVTGVKMKAKKRHKKFFGHRQPFTEIEITTIKTR